MVALSSLFILFIKIKKIKRLFSEKFFFQGFKMYLQSYYLFFKGENCILLSSKFYFIFSQASSY